MACACRCEETHHLAFKAICSDLQSKARQKATIEATQKRYRIEQEFYDCLEDTKNGL